MPIQFFFSYARDDQDPYLDSFYAELVEEVRLRVGESKAHVGRLAFRDKKKVELGQRWRDEIWRALGTSEVFVYLCSPLYLRSEWCKKEWAAFATRLPDNCGASPDGGKALRRMIPVVWIPAPQMVEAIGEFQYTHDSPPEYAKEGLRYLAKMEPAKYEKVLHQLVDAVLTAAQGGPELKQWDARPDVDQLRPPWDASGQAEPAQAGDGPSPGVAPTPRSVSLVVVVATREELESPDCRLTLAAYGNGPNPELCWRPYYPPDGTCIAPCVASAVSAENLFPEIIPLGDDLAEQLRQAETENKIVVLVVDPLTLSLKKYRSRLAPFDQERFYNCCVLVPVNEQDPEVRRRSADWGSLLEATFPRQAVGGGLPDLVTSSEAFKERIAGSLTRCRMNIMRAAKLCRPATGPGPKSTPAI